MVRLKRAGVVAIFLSFLLLGGGVAHQPVHGEDQAAGGTDPGPATGAPAVVSPGGAPVITPGDGAPAAKDAPAGPRGLYQWPVGTALRYRYTASTFDAVTDVINAAGKIVAHESLSSRVALDFTLDPKGPASAPATGAAPSAPTQVDLAINRLRFRQDIRGEALEEILGLDAAAGRGEWERTLNGKDIIPDGKSDAQRASIEKLLAKPIARLTMEDTGGAALVEAHPDLTAEPARRDAYDRFVRLSMGFTGPSGSRSRPLSDLLEFCFPAPLPPPGGALVKGSEWKRTLDKFLRDDERTGVASRASQVEATYRVDEVDEVADEARISYTGVIVPKAAKPVEEPAATDRQKYPHQFPRVSDQPGDGFDYSIKGRVIFKPRAGRLVLHTAVFTVRRFVEVLHGLKSISKGTSIYRVRLVTPDSLLDATGDPARLGDNNEEAADLNPTERGSLPRGTEPGAK
ncbi:MAG: hypothetical protein HY719_09975 [Planctomycetes bacterium]|nr:hypothetical protein [Planctomycetota bacterium]